MVEHGCETGSEVAEVRGVEGGEEAADGLRVMEALAAERLAAEREAAAAAERLAELRKAQEQALAAELKQAADRSADAARRDSEEQLAAVPGALVDDEAMRREIAQIRAEARAAAAQRRRE